MILVWGLLEDPTTRAVCDCLSKLGAKVAFVNHAEVAHTHVRYISVPGASFRLCCGGVTYELSDVSAAYLRPYDYRDYAGYRSSIEGRGGNQELVHHLLGAWAEQSDARIVNRPSAEASNHSKLFQAMHIRASGFRVPASLVSNDLTCVRQFLAEHGAVIYKSMSSVRSVVRTLDPIELDKVGPMGPVFFQQRVRGTNVRVHVVGSASSTCSIETDGVDYRYASATRFTQTELPREVAERAVKLTRALGLALAGLDLILGEDGEWYCLEVNPNPAFSVFEPPGEALVAQRVAEFLVG